MTPSERCLTASSYKRIGDLDIQAAILKPKNMSLGRHPVIFTIHGGFLMTAHSLFAPFFSPVVLRLAERNSAIIISADYRLLPTVNGVTDVLEDIEDAWQWSRRELPAIMKTHLPGHQLDLSRVLVQGGSAGGYGALQLGLSHPDDVTAVIMTYPLVDVQDPIFVTGPKDGEDTVLRVPLESMPSVEETKSWIERNKTITTLKAGHERSPYNAATTQYGLFYDHVFNPQKVDDHDLLPLERIKSGARVPRRLSVFYTLGHHHSFSCNSLILL